MSYIATWGRGVQKIWDAFKELGAEMPRYELLGNGLRIYFKALKSAIIDEPKVPKEHFGTLDGTLEEKVVQIILGMPSAAQSDIADRSGAANVLGVF